MTCNTVALALLDDRTAGLLGVLILAGTYNAVLWLVWRHYSRSHRDIAFKKRIKTSMAILSGAVMFLLATLTAGFSLGLFSLVPITLITYLNIRSKDTCATCGRTIAAWGPFSPRWHHSRCPERNPNKFF